MAYFLDRRSNDRALDIVGHWDKARVQSTQQIPYSTKLGQFMIGEKAERSTISRWEFLGPGNVGGRTRALVINPDNTQIMYAAGVSGGIWKSLDGGASWQPRGELLANLSVVALALDPEDPNTLIAGTGEGVYLGRPETRSRGVRGDGVFISHDAGDSWEHLAVTANNPDFHYVNRIAFGNDGRLYAPTNSGLWLSDDLGQSWQRTLEPEFQTSCLEVAVQPQSSPDVVLVSCGNFVAGATYRSADSGESWTRVLGGDEGPSEAWQGRTVVAFSQSEPNIAYALAAVNRYNPGNSGLVAHGLLALYRSDDGGQSWEVRTDGRDLSSLGSLILSNPEYSTDVDCNIIEDRFGQGWFSSVLTVDPRDSDVLWVGGLDLFRSDDGGQSWGLASYWWIEEGATGFLHADHHLVVFSPDYDGADNTIMYSANDGGLYRTSNPNASTSTNICEPESEIVFEPLNNSYGVTQFYHGSVFPGGDRYMGGTQDNGTNMGTDEQGPDQWWRIRGADGGYSGIDPDDPDIFYTTIQYGSPRRTEDGGETQIFISPFLTHIGPTVFIPPLVMDPQDSSTLWMGGTSLVRTRDRGDNWADASAVLTPGTRDSVTAIAVSPNNSNRVIAGTELGRVVSTNRGLTSDIDTEWAGSVLAQGWVSSIRFDAGDPGTVYATYSTFGVPHVWRSRNNGRSWKKLASIGLPDVPVHDIAIDPVNSQRLFLGTDIGLFVSVNGGANWAPDPFAASGALIETLEIVDRDGEPWLYAFTYGRGAFRTPLSSVRTIPVATSHSGTWYNLERNGEGFIVEVSEAQDGSASVFWFTYTDNGNPAWYFADADVRGDRIIADPLYAARGPTFGADFDPADLALSEFGRLELLLNNCNEGVYVYQANADFGGKSDAIAIQRLSSVQDASCTAVAEKGLGPNLSGNWFDPSHNGEGFLIQNLDSNPGQLLVYWFTYDPEGAPFWMFNTGTLQDNQLTIDPLIATRGPSFGPGYDPNDLIVEQWGSVEFAFSDDCESATASYQGPPEFGNGSFELERLTRIVACQGVAAKGSPDDPDLPTSRAH